MPPHFQKLGNELPKTLLLPKNERVSEFLKSPTCPWISWFTENVFEEAVEGQLAKQCPVSQGVQPQFCSFAVLINRECPKGQAGTKGGTSKFREALEL